MSRRSYTCSAWCKGDVVGIVEVEAVDEDTMDEVGNEIGLGSGSVGSATVVGWSTHGSGSGADSERDRLENRNSLRAPDRSVVLKIRFFRRPKEGVVFLSEPIGSC